LQGVTKKTQINLKHFYDFLLFILIIQSTTPFIIYFINVIIICINKEVNKIVKKNKNSMGSQYILNIPLACFKLIINKRQN